MIGSLEKMEKAISALQVSEAERAAILRGNARQLLGLEAGGASHPPTLR